MRSTHHPPSRIITLIGPTCVGKTAVGIALARHLNAEIISADSRQIYRYMDIGTAKPSSEEQQIVPHHLIDIVNPDVRFSAGEFARQADKVLDNLHQQGKSPLIVGGAGLYLQALMGGLFTSPVIPPDVRAKVAAHLQAMPTDSLYNKLQTVDVESSARIHPNDRQRIERALEVYEATGTSLTAWHRKSAPGKPDHALMLIGLNRPRVELYDRINQRVDRMLDRGLVEEVHRLLGLGYTEVSCALKTFGYAEILNYIKGSVSLEAAADQIRLQSRRYAKRQLTWFRNREEILWIDIEGDESPNSICDRIVAQIAPN